MAQYETRHYRVLSDVEPNFARELGQKLDAMYDEYARRLAVFGEAGDAPRFDVYIFARRLDYSKLTGNRFPNTGGVFMSGRNLLAVFVEGQGRQATRRTLQHEAFHQFAHTHIARNLPPWVNEGLAQVFEEGVWTGQGYSVGELPPRRLRQLKSDLKDDRITPFAQFVTMDDRAWQDAFADKDRITTQYNQAWAMVHFLIYAADETGQPRFRQRFIQYLKDIRTGKAPDDAWRASFGGNFAGFEQRFREWAGIVQPTPLAAAMERQEVIADMLVLLDEKQIRFDSVEALRSHLRTSRPRLHYTRGTIKWSTDADPLVYLRDSAGRDLDPSAVQFSPRAGAPLPDLVIRPAAGLQLRTRFLCESGGIEHETTVESG